MEATVSKVILSPDGSSVPVGTRVTMVESVLLRGVDFGDGHVSRVPREDLRFSCQVPGCEREATYDAPGCWCSVHWTEWWTAEGDEPEWMDFESDRLDPFVILKTDLELPHGVTHAAGTAVTVLTEHLTIRVRLVDGIEVTVARDHLSITCEVTACQEEAQLWRPCYVCREHHGAWLDGEIELPGTDFEEDPPLWRQGPGAGRPPDYPDLSPREQWEIDKRLGILDENW
jgi:hypothetical protein